MMQIATLVVVSVCAVASLVLGLLSYWTVRKSARMTRDNLAQSREMFAFSRSLMSRFVASNNLQAEIYCADKEERENANETRRLEDATEVQEVIYLR